MSTLKQRVYSHESFVPTKNVNGSFVLLHGEGESDSEVWVARVLLLFHFGCGSKTEKYCFVQYMHTIPPLDMVDQSLGCVCVSCKTIDSVNYTVQDPPTGMRTDGIEVGELYEVVKFATILGTVHVLRSNFAIQPFSNDLPWTHHRFYVNRLYREPNVLKEENVVEHDTQRE